MLSWQQSAHDVHVATRDGEYAGHVVVDDGFTVFGPAGQALGGSRTLTAARRTLQAFAAGTRVPARSRPTSPYSASAPSPRYRGSLTWSHTTKE